MGSLTAPPQSQQVAGGGRRPSSPVAGKAQRRGRRRHKVRRPAPPRAPRVPAAAGDRDRRAGNAASPGRPAPLPRDRPGALGAAPRHSLRDFAEPTRALWPLRGDSPRTITRKRRGSTRVRDLRWSPRIPRRGNGGPRTGFSLRPSRAGAGHLRRVPGALSLRSPATHAGAPAPRAARFPPLPLLTLPREQSELAPVSASPRQAPS